ncbi:MAG TPA: PQQ-dependent sugar dehydrogenase [Bryobacteraceae bacterium]|jgi:glucose/arabinose dehydrogenase|nr:PQQ-dependent sugar dehydrogenase [Bryobacteraceae bacterium]
MKHRLYLSGAFVLAGTVLIAQQPANAPPAGAPGAFGRGPGGRGRGRGPGRGAPTYQLEAGKPIDPRPSSKTDDHASWEGQTRAPYEPSGVAYTVTTVTDKLVAPWSIAFLPGTNGRMLVTEKQGNMRIVDPDGAVSEPLTGVPMVHFQGQVGLLDLALDKNFMRNRRIFFTYSENVNDMDSHIVLASATLNPDLKGITGAHIIFGSMPALSNRRAGANQGGRIAVDRAGNLFVAIGDRAPTPPTDYGQRNDTTIGKMLHLTPEGKPVPGNPYIGKAGYAPEVYSMGHRSPEGLAINPANGELWETEHGPQGGDELNKIEPGKNYGWPVITHGIDYNNTPITGGIVEKEGLEQPRYYWNPVIAPSGMAFYQGKQFPGWKDSIFSGGLGAQLLDRLHMDWKTNKVIGEEPLLLEPGIRARIRDVRFGPDGMIYVLTDSNPPATAKMYKITPKK